MKKNLIINNNHTCTLPTNVNYNFKILEACFNMSGTTLQMMILLESLCASYHDIVFEEIEIGSPLFERFVSLVYATERDEVIDFDIEKIKTFTGITRLSKNDETGKNCISWENVMPSNIPVSSADQFRRKPRNATINTNNSSQFMILKNGHTCNLLTNLEYHFAIIKACFSPKGDTLQLMILLKCDELNHFDITFEEYQIGSEDFNNFVNVAYTGEACTVIDFCPDRLSDCWGTVMLKQTGNNVCVDWRTAEADSTPMSSVGMLKLDWQ